MGFKLIQTNSNISNHSNFIRFKKDLHELIKFEIKYSFEKFDERNNFCHRNFLGFEVGFE
jgi:hypothetical protein